MNEGPSLNCEKKRKHKLAISGMKRRYHFRSSRYKKLAVILRYTSTVVRLQLPCLHLHLNPQTGSF